MVNFPPELENSNIEYKRQMINVSDDRFSRLQSQLKRRLTEGRGEAIYRIGIEDNGSVYGLSDEDFKISSDNLRLLSDSIDVEMSLMYKRETKNGLFYGEYIIRDNQDYVDLFIATGGHSNAGKSTLVGSLVTGELDIRARHCAELVMKYSHEKTSGNTSHVAHEIIGIREARIINSDLYQTSHNRVDWRDIVTKSNKVITVKDLAGHQKYFKTTLRGINGLPDYVMMIFNGVSGDLGGTSAKQTSKKIDKDNLDDLIRGPTKTVNVKGIKDIEMAEEHMKLCYIWKIPIIAIVTHIDVANMNDQIDKTVEAISSYCNKKLRRKTKIINMNDDINQTLLEELKSNRTVPILKVSSRTGQNMNILKHMLSLLPVCRPIQNSTDLKYSVEETFYVKGHGLVLSGYIISGTICTGDIVMFGPCKMSKGYYVEVKIRTMERNRVRISRAKAGQHVTVNITGGGVTRKMVHKGMTLIGYRSKQVVVSKFRAKIQLQNHSTITVKQGYQSIIYLENIREACSIHRIYNETTLNIEKLYKQYNCTFKTFCEIVKEKYPEHYKIVEASNALRTESPNKEEINWFFNRLNSKNILGPGGIAIVDISMIARPINLSNNSRFIWSDNSIVGVGLVQEILS